MITAESLAQSLAEVYEQGSDMLNEVLEHIEAYTKANGAFPEKTEAALRNLRRFVESSFADDMKGTDNVEAQTSQSH